MSIAIERTVERAGERAVKLNTSLRTIVCKIGVRVP